MVYFWCFFFFGVPLKSVVHSFTHSCSWITLIQWLRQQRQSTTMCCDLWYDRLDVHHHSHKKWSVSVTQPPPPRPVPPMSCWNAIEPVIFRFCLWHLSTRTHTKFNLFPISLTIIWNWHWFSFCKISFTWISFLLPHRHIFGRRNLKKEYSCTHTHTSSPVNRRVFYFNLNNITQSTQFVCVYLCTLLFVWKLIPTRVWCC